ncbi:Uncharacterised protein [Ectopseudomonas oleovorans]|uniref:Uncharacterized protein n=1 Tax=Ectopseudomonas oleovorans TaxID=301 RepID=A0A379PLA6_ECTOL|nr:Uncharacterised protein [Pseudomonas oleovorans]
MPRHRPESAERRASPGDHWESTSTGTLCTHAPAPTGISRAPRFTRPPTGAHFYRNPVCACPGTDRNQPSAVLHPATIGNPLLPEPCVRMPRHRPESAERRVSPGHPREPTSTGILCAHAPAPTGISRAPCFTRRPLGIHFYRNPVYACPGTDRNQPSAVLHPATLGNPLLPESCVRMPRHRPETAERRGSPSHPREPTSTGILCAAPLVSTGNSRAPRLTNHPWNPCPTGIPSARPRCRLESAERRGIEVILVQESCVRKHGVIGLWRTPVSCWVRDSPSSYRKQACALPSVILQGGGPSVLRSART